MGKLKPFLRKKITVTPFVDVVQHESATQGAKASTLLGQPIGHPIALVVAFLSGFVYIPLAATGSETVNKANVLAVHLGLAFLAVYWLPDALRSYSHRTLRWATVCHSLVAVCHAVAAIAILMFKLERDGDNILECLGHLATCGVILGLGKLAQLVFLLEHHFTQTKQYQEQKAVSQGKPRLVRLGHWVKARVRTRQGIIGLIITVPTIFCTTMVFTTFDFTSDCVYTAEEPWKTGTSVCASLLMGMVMLLYLQMAYHLFKLPGDRERMLAYRFGVVGVLSVSPTLSADFYVLYVAPAFTIEVCLNYCAWFMFVGLVAIRYLQNVNTTLCLQTSSFVDVSSWRVLSSCTLHDKMVGSCLVDADFRMLVLPQDRPQLDRLHNSAENTHLLLLRIQASPQSPVCTMSVRLLKVGDDIWQLNMEDITRYVTSTELPLQEYRDAMHTLQEPIMILNSELDIVFCNAAMVDFANLHDHSVGQTATSAFPGLHLFCTSAVCATGWKETMLRTPVRGGVRERNVHLAFSTLSLGGKVLYIVSAQDVHTFTKDLRDQLNDKMRNGLNQLHSIITLPAQQYYNPTSASTDWNSSSGSEGQREPNEAEDIIASMSTALSLLLGEGAITNEGGVSASGDAALVPRGVNVLVVDDSKINLALLSRYFTKAAPFDELGWHVFTAQTGEEALEKINGPDAFWLVVFDQNMELAGGVLTGTQATRQILAMPELDPKPIIFGATSHTGPEDLVEATAAGQQHVWGKPYPKPTAMFDDLCRVALGSGPRQIKVPPQA